MCRRACSSQIFVRKIENDLVVRIRVDGRHRAADDGEIIVDDFGDRSQAICGARRVRNDVMLCRIVLVMVDAHNQRDIFILCWSGDDHFLDCPAKVLLGFVGVSETSGRFDHDLRADRFPRQRGRVFFFENLDGFAINRNAVGACGNFVGQVAKNGVVFQEDGRAF